MSMPYTVSRGDPDTHRVEGAAKSVLHQLNLDRQKKTTQRDATGEAAEGRKKAFARMSTRRYCYDGVVESGSTGRCHHVRGDAWRQTYYVDRSDPDRNPPLA